MSGGTQKSLRKALGALKDTTTVSLAKVNSDYKVDLFGDRFCWMGSLDQVFCVGSQWVYGFPGIGHFYS